MILIVEDEFLLRLDLEMLLEDEGLAVLSVANADEAIKILSQRTDVQLVMTDINMPGSMNGMALCGTVAHRWPHIRMMVLSSNRAPEKGCLPENVPFYSKPYEPDDLIEKMRAILP